MGNCLRKSAQNPNQSLDIAQPPTGKRAKNVKPGIPFEERNLHVVSNKQRGRCSNDERHSNIPNMKEWNLLKMNKELLFQTCKLKRFNYKVLKDATRKFCEENFIGRGGFGDVYKGYIAYCTMEAAKPSEGYPIAVKRTRRPGEQGQEEWLKEVLYLSKINHPNVVKLIGYCWEGEHRMLVYEYMIGGNLEDNLLKDSARLNWTKRIKIAVGLARGLDYLHSYGRPLIHRDIKSSNVLLDANFNPKLSDFGLARYGPEGDNSHVTTRILGTRGYFAPEYFATGHLTLKADVYSFGVVLLEILTAFGPFRKHSYGKMGTLVQWAEPYLSNTRKLSRIIDKRLEKNFPMTEACGFAEITLCCLSINPKQRPTMAEVLANLEKLELKLALHNL